MVQLTIPLLVVGTRKMMFSINADVWCIDSIHKLTYIITYNNTYVNIWSIIDHGILIPNMEAPKTAIVPIDELKPNPKNPRSITEAGMERLKAQIKKLGIYKPIIVDERTGMVCGGHMRLEALKALGHGEAWVSYVNTRDDQEALEYALSDNDRAGYYDADFLANLSSEFPDLPWDKYAIELSEAYPLPQLSMPSVDLDTPRERDMSEATVATANQCPSCGYKW